MRLVPALAIALVLAPAHDTLAVRVDGAWREWWRADRAPARWAASEPTLSAAIRWHASAPGVEWGDAELSAPGEGWRTRLIVVRIEPARQRFALQLAQGENFAPSWTIDSAGDSALVGVNAGQFNRILPWGWLVQNGRELSPPGVGPLSMAVVFDSTGAVRLVSADSLASVRGEGGIANAFQSYPTLLTGDGTVPAELRADGRGVDLRHRDSRVAIGELRDGRLLLAMTRFNALGDAAAAVPFGLTVPEMAALMGALGCRRAVSLDGGISGQLVVREADGSLRKWTGWRRVPLGLIVLPRSVAVPAVP
jgi:hypothetical protein